MSLVRHITAAQKHGVMWKSNDIVMRRLGILWHILTIRRGMTLTVAFHIWHIWLATLLFCVNLKSWVITMNDVVRAETDRKLKQLERKIRGHYRKSAKGIYQKWQDFMRESAAEIAKLQEAYDFAVANHDAKLKQRIDKELSRAKLKVLLQNDYYKAMLAEITRQLAHINATAQAYTNGMIPEFYTINYNAIAKNPQLPKMGVDFAMADAHTVKRLMLDGEITVPLRKFDEKKDIAWNTRQMNSSILQGILQGESIPKIADRIYPIVGNNENSAVRYARTMTTSAECHGRLDSYQELANRGVVLTKVWIATPDDRTRPSHIDMDGEEQNIDDEFSNGCMFPGDGNGSPDEVWNCRCSIRTHIIGYKHSDGSISRVNYQRDRTLHDEQMERERARREEENNVNANG